MTTDPGAVPRDARPLDDDQQERDHEAKLAEEGTGLERYKKFCKRCKTFKPSRAHHCSMCGRCIIKMDHHCPWVNNCVGIGNHKLFLLFIAYTFGSCMYSLLLVLSKYIVCIYTGHHCTETGFLFCLFLTVESILFGLFTLCMMGDQLPNITTNQTQIDRLKGATSKVITEVNEVCGSHLQETFNFEWLVPSAVVFRDRAMRDRVLGYCRQAESDLCCQPVAEDCVPLMAGHSSNSSKHSSGIELRQQGGGGGGGNTPKDLSPHSRYIIDQSDHSVYGEEAITLWLDEELAMAAGVHSGGAVDGNNAGSSPAAAAAGGMTHSAPLLSAADPAMLKKEEAPQKNINPAGIVVKSSDNLNIRKRNGV